jgi:cytochrome P450
MSTEQLPKASLAESARFVATGLVPSLARGLFKPRRTAMKALTALDADARAVKVLSALRAKHGGQGVRLLGGRMVTLWGSEAIREVLDRSGTDFASDSGAKAKGMGHFQPDALTLSRGDEWRDRRAFNESVLATSETVHPDAARFLAVVADEVERLEAAGTLTWSDWERLFDRITLRVVFGDRARGETRITELLEQLMNEANRLVGLSTDGAYHELYGRLERQLRDPEPGSLVARFADAPQSDTTRIVQQLPHWLFAMRDTLGANAYRALALVVAGEAVEARVREELESADLSDAQAVAGLRYLEGCLQEAMRLWPTTPLLAREATRRTQLAGTEVDEGTQVMILNTFNHRDADTVPDADRLRPERWLEGERDVRFNHLSGGAQYCPGVPLVLLLGKAVLARALERWLLTLEEPALDVDADLPHMLDFFDITFRVRPQHGR